MAHHNTARRGVSQSFIDRADAAAFWEAWVGSVLARAGLYTTHHPFLADGLDTHSLTWDLEVSMNWVPHVPVEVKAPSIHFNNPADYPFEDALVCSESSWQKKWPMEALVSRDFLFVSTQTGAIVWLPKKSNTFTKKITDSSRDSSYVARATSKYYLKSLGDFIDYIKGQYEA